MRPLTLPRSHKMTKRLAVNVPLRQVLVVVSALWVGCLPRTVLAQPSGCPERHTLYVPVETVSGPLGLRGETRAQYLNRVYGKGVWREGSGGVAVVARDGDSVRVKLREQEGVAPERVDVIAEARLEYLATQGALRSVTGHREIGRYALATDALGNLSVPLSVLRESGALLIVVSARFASPSGPVVLVEVWPHAIQACERRILVPDRFTAIRLNRNALEK
jgi:hypothetical protein